MTSSFELHFTSIEDFLDELRADHGAGDQGESHVKDHIVRLALRTSTASLGQLYPKQQYVPGADRPAPFMRSRFVEASYVSSRDQLVKVSAYCGIEADGYPEGGPAAMYARFEATALKAKETTHKLQAAFAALPGLVVRGGGLFVENGAWTASPESPIEAPPEQMCATCRAPIYFANNLWRHTGSKQAEAYNLGMPTPTGRRKLLDHLADPEVAGRKV